MKPSLSPAVALAGQLREAGDLRGARQLLLRETAANPAADILSDLAALCLELNDLPAAEASLSRALAQPRPPVQAHVNAGILARRTGREPDAEQYFRAAIERDPRHPGARLHLATLLLDRARLDEAATQIAVALRDAPNDPVALGLLARIRFLQRRFTEALDAYRAADRAGADIRLGLTQLAHAFAHVCDWRRRDEIRRAMRAAIRRPPQDPRHGIVDCFAVIAHEDDPALQRRAASTLAATVRAHVGPAPRRPPHPPRTDGRLHIAYLSCDFHQHATAELLVGILEHHDRDRFLVTAYSYGLDDGSPMQSRIRAAPERFVPLGLESSAASADRIAADGVDILIDLKGYSEGARPEIPALRPAPIQLAWLGFPATMAADWIDFIIADPHALPLSEQPHFDERILHLPCSYQPNDDRRVRPEPDHNRAAHGLPVDALVLACFNNAYKITPERFATWMDILAALPGSVLWLIESNDFMAANLRAAARARRIDPARLVFSPVLDQAPHLARHGCADIFLDTAPYGAHTTASNALWMGVPVVTTPGRCFASRVGASLLHAVQTPELIAGDEATYRSLVIELGRDPLRRQSIGNRAQVGALFDTGSTTRALEGILGALPQAPPGPAAPDPH